MTNMESRAAVVLDANGAIGRAIALEPGKAGAKVYVTGKSISKETIAFSPANRFAAPIMVRDRKGLIVNIHHENQRQHIGKTLLEVSRATIDQLTEGIQPHRTSKRVWGSDSTRLNLVDGVAFFDSITGFVTPGWEESL